MKLELALDKLYSLWSKKLALSFAEAIVEFRFYHLFANMSVKLYCSNLYLYWTVFFEHTLDLHLLRLQ